MKKLFCLFFLFVLISNSLSQWEQAKVPSECRINCFANVGTKIFAGADYGGVFKSTDFGNSWEAVNTGLRYTCVTALAVMDTVLFAGTNEGGVYISSDYGLNWESISKGFVEMDKHIYSLVVSGKNIIMSGFYYIYLSSDKGQSWERISKGLSKHQYCLAAFGNYIYAADNDFMFTGNESKGIYRSSDNGKNWILVNNGLKSLYVSVLAANEKYIYAGTNNKGVFISTDIGESWKAINNGLNYYRIYSLDVSDENILISTDKGIFHSTNNGISWKNSGLNKWKIKVLKISGSTLFASDCSKVILRSTDFGINWDVINNGIINRIVESILVSGTNVYAGTETGEILNSTDEGSTWAAVTNDSINKSVISLAVSKSDLYAGTFWGGINLSTDEGNSWVPVNNGLKRDGYGSRVISTIITADSIVYIGTWGGIYFSTNRGENWISFLDTYNKYDINTMAKQGEKLFFGGFRGLLYRSLDTDTGWQYYNILGDKLVRTIFVFDSTILAGTNEGMIYCSSDKGLNWNVTCDVGMYNDIWCFTKCGQNIYAGTYKSGVVVSTDGGLHWGNCSEGLKNRDVRALASWGDKIYAGTYGNGVFILKNDYQNLIIRPDSLRFQINPDAMDHTSGFQ